MVAGDELVEETPVGRTPTHRNLARKGGLNAVGSFETELQAPGNAILHVETRGFAIHCGATALKRHAVYGQLQLATLLASDRLG